MSDVCQRGTGNPLADSFKRAGFGRVTSDRPSTELLYDDGDAATDAAFVGGPVGMAYSRFDDATWAEGAGRACRLDRAVPCRSRFPQSREFVIARADR